MKCVFESDELELKEDVDAYSIFYCIVYCFNKIFIFTWYETFGRQHWYEKGDIEVWGCGPTLFIVFCFKNVMGPGTLKGVY